MVRHVKQFSELIPETTIDRNTSFVLDHATLGIPKGAAIVGVCIGLDVTANSTTSDLTAAWYPIFEDSNGGVHHSASSQFSRVITAGDTHVFLLATDNESGVPFSGNGGAKILIYGPSSSWGASITFKAYGTLVIEY